MDSKDRLLAFVKGRSVDRKPTLDWPSPDPSADVKVIPTNDFNAGSANPTLALVPNVFRLLELMGKDPVATSKSVEFSSLVESIEDSQKKGARTAISNGALGVLYEIHGADASQCTPMEYGGLFLEKDRAFLESVADAPCNFIYVNGKEPYLDFVSDLPAAIFAWDAKGSGIPVSEVRKMRNGSLAADDADADLPLSNGGSITETLKGAMAHV